MRLFSFVHLPQHSVFDRVQVGFSRLTLKCHYISLLEDECSSIKKLKQIHAQVVTVGLSRSTFVMSRILAFCAISVNGDLDYARQVFYQVEYPTIFNWNTMIRAYSLSSNPESGIWFYKQMLCTGLNPNQHTYPFVLKACPGCSSSFLGRLVHAHVAKFGFELDIYVVSALIAMYSRCGSLQFAQQVFDESPKRNIASWTSLITGYCGCGMVQVARQLFAEMPDKNEVAWSAIVSGYVRNDCFSEAIEVFNELRKAKKKPNSSMLVSVLSACAAVGAVEEGKWVHSYIDENKLGYGLELGTALVNFYAKTGCIGTALKVFERMPEKDVLAWSAMIMGLAVHGFTSEAIDFLVKMEENSVKPNSITFIGLLSACNHGGLVEQGWYYFNLMRTKYGISPTIEHYGCIVDLMSRAGKLVDAENLINSMPMKPDGIVWGALLNGCMIHGSVELGERVGKHLIELDPHHSGRYVLLANLYATMGDWDGVRSIRRRMRDKKVIIIPGCSFIEINGIIDRFLVHDKSHPQSTEIYGILNALNGELRSSYYDNWLVTSH
ncbi:pentatricopeptide repeat-containing protein At5g66520-like [Nymphaea colorata]|nr:pentatricopeptide repeat-containing protein At5g66520-like [Nymphaea colorata]XP_031488750.1 pentatricopeptide repeat-containing protein At5g66520-like [Nymphaea colorata]XP_031488752.1 pentatricopeptide repeat-containing protein At5g66520-like [Nymphaea colorata]XP_031488753.1 pentatricopeptide repeat-containing protein At5g66520-like [Nymphaea colorata]XP_049934412.1 pentatricopeptide repeat-containing protein At5g66520-like [Nymphaea colorata]